MRKIDFLSEYPNLYIFQQERHKTNFGGVLFLIYIIIMLIISSSYIIDFIINDKFEVENLSIKNQTKFEDLEAIDANENYNPLTEFRVSIPLENYPEFFRIRYTDENNVTHIENFTERYYFSGLKQFNFSGETMAMKFKSRISDFKSEIFLFCGDGYCNDIVDMLEGQMVIIGFEPLFPKIDHQNPLKPILDDDKFGQYIPLIQEISDRPSYYYDYRVVQYKEKKGLSRIFDKLLDLKSEYFTGYLIFDTEGIVQITGVITIDGNKYRHVNEIHINNPHEAYDEYKRKGRTELDVLSTISALFTPIRLVFLIIYRFDIKKFNNYKIIENILDLKNKPKKFIELKNISEIKDSSIKDLNDNEKQEILIKSEIEEKPDDNTEENNEEKKDSNENKSDKDTKGIILPKYFFGQFFLNNIYCQCCKRRKCLKEFNKYHQQDILELCNTINMKYLSLNSLLYNQIMIENLLKDYNWNNSSLNNIKNNELIFGNKNIN